MEVKKSQKADLENKKSLFLEIGLIASLLLMIVLFGFSQSEKKIENLSTEEEFVQVEQVEITRQDEPIAPSVPTPAQALSVLADAIQIVDNDTKIETNMVFSDFDENFEFTSNVTSTKEVLPSGDSEFFMIVEDMPRFQGGDIAKFRTWVMSKIQYPAMAQSMQIQGQVTLSFIIEKDGSLTNIEVLQSADSLLDKEAIRVVQSSPKWEPGKQRDVPVRVKFTLPVNFQLQN